MSNLIKELKRSNYRLLGLVGQGQFGRVYCASHRKTGQLFALKELDKQRFPTHKFLRELRFLLSLQHSNVVICRALEHTQTGRYLVMDYCEGGTLRNLMEEGVRLHPIHCLKLVADVLAGLEHAHGRGIVHCDIKPENILLTLTAQGWIARISDFGIARLSQEMTKEEAGNTGSPAYMAPERFYGQYSHTSDLYAVGILLFELLVGHRPFSGAPADLMMAHLNHPVIIPATLPNELKTILRTALQKLSGRRFRSTTEMRSAVQAAIVALADTWNEEWASSMLLRPTLELPCCPYQTVQEQPLQAEVRQLVGVSHSFQVADTNLDAVLQDGQASKHARTAPPQEQLYQVSGSHVECHYPARALAGESQLNLPGRLAQVSLPEAIDKLIVRPQGCFALTKQSLYCLPVAFQPNLATEKQSSEQHLAIQTAVPQLVADFKREVIADIDPQGEWLATVSPESERTRHILSIWQLKRRMPSAFSLNRSSQIHGHHASTVQISRPALHLFQIIALDHRHLGVFSHRVDQESNSCITGILLEVFTRRGNLIGSFSLPVPLRHIFVSPRPYRLVAIEPGHRNALLFIDLKPLRTLRVGLEITPVLITATDWGYVLVADDGQIVLLDQHGQGVGRTQGPANPTAVVVLNLHILLISTWKDGHGSLHTVDLRQLDLGMLF